VPLELVFEHRNYFASIGTFTALFAPLLLRIESLRLVRHAAAFALLALFAVVTWIRANEWGDPVLFAMSEADKNPHSPRTAYELGRTYVVLSGYRPESPFVALAQSTLERAAAMPNADALPDQALLMLASHLHQPAPDNVWENLRDKLAHQPLNAENAAALYALTECSIKAQCELPPDRMIDAFLAALAHEPPSPVALSIYANYAANVLHDRKLALELALAAVAQAPDNLQYRSNVLLLMLQDGQLDTARDFYRRTLQEMPAAARDKKWREWAKAAQLDTPP
jgi:hypothetical protein